MENNQPQTPQEIPQENQPQNQMEAPSEKEQLEQQKLFAGKYHSVDALEQGYKELSRLVREKSPEVPDEYTLDFSEEPELAQVVGEINVQEDPLWQHMTPAMRESNLSQEQAQNVTKAFLGWQQQQAQAEKQAFDAMGAEGQAMAQRVNRFIEKNVPEEQVEMAHGLASSVSGLKFLNTLAEGAGEQAIPTQSSGMPQTSQILKEKAFAMLAEPDLAYNQEKQQAYNRLWQDIDALER